MPRVCFTPNLQRHVNCPEVVVEATTVAEALETVFAQHPKLRGYILNDQGALHRHMAVVVNGVAIRDREKLSQAIQSNDEIFVLQSLSGG